MTGKPAHGGDDIILGARQWARPTSPWPLIEPDTPSYAWRDRILDLHDGHDGHARSAPAAG